MQFNYRRVAILLLAICAFGFGNARATEPCRLVRTASLDLSPDQIRPVITAEIMGRPTRLLVGTGSPYNYLNEEIADELHIGKALWKGFIIDLDGNEVRNYSILNDFKLGDLKNDRAVFLISPRLEGHKRQYEGVFGSDFLAAQDVEFDFFHKKMNLYAHNEDCGDKVVYWSDEFVEIKSELYGNRRLTFVATLNGKNIIAAINTNMADTIILSKAAVDLFDLPPPQPATPDAPDSSASYVHRFDKLEMGGIAFNNVDITVRHDNFGFLYPKTQEFASYRGKYDLLIGMHELSKLHLFIAYSQSKIYATAANAGEPH